MTDTPLTLPLGTRVRVRRVLVRTRVLNDRPVYSNGEVKEWAPYPARWVDVRRAYLDGVIAGHRTLTNGATTWNGEDGTDYRPTGTVPAYLVAWDLRRALVRVRPEDLELLALPGWATVVDDDAEPDPRDVLL